MLEPAAREHHAAVEGFPAGDDTTDRAIVGVAETPLGLFYVMAKFRPSEAVLGAFTFQTSGYSKLSDWPGGGVVGVHGTNAPELIGRAVSHGCVRMRNADVEFLKSVVRVGTPIKIVAS